MDGLKLSEPEIHGKARDIVDQLTGLPGIDAFMVLQRALGTILYERLVSEPQGTGRPLGLINPFLRRRGRGRIFRIDADPEIREFVLGQTEYLPIDDLHALIVSRFGKTRAPSRSSLHRYIQKHSNPIEETESE